MLDFKKILLTVTYFYYTVTIYLSNLDIENNCLAK